MGFKYSVVDPDVCYTGATKNDYEGYYKYIIFYVGDFLAISLDARSIILEVAENFKLKKDKIDPPKVYLGERISKKSLNGKDIWNISNLDIDKAVIKNIKVSIKKEEMKLPARAETPMSLDFKPE